MDTLILSLKFLGYILRYASYFFSIGGIVYLKGFHINEYITIVLTEEYWNRFYETYLYYIVKISNFINSILASILIHPPIDDSLFDLDLNNLQIYNEASEDKTIFDSYDEILAKENENLSQQLSNGSDCEEDIEETSHQLQSVNNCEALPHLDNINNTNKNVINSNSDSINSVETVSQDSNWYKILLIIAVLGVCSVTVYYYWDYIMANINNFGGNDGDGSQPGNAPSNLPSNTQGNLSEILRGNQPYQQSVASSSRDITASVASSSSDLTASAASSSSDITIKLNSSTSNPFYNILRKGDFVLNSYYSSDAINSIIIKSWRLSESYGFLSQEPLVFMPNEYTSYITGTTLFNEELKIPMENIVYKLVEEKNLNGFNQIVINLGDPLNRNVYSETLRPYLVFSEESFSKITGIKF